MSLEDGKIEVGGRKFQVVTIDFETFYDKSYTLSGKLNTSEYIRDERFHVHGVGIKIGNERTKWYTGKNIAQALSEIDWSKTALNAHNTSFDGFILSEVFGHKPAFYLDTLSMARAALGHHIRHDLDTVAKALGFAGKVKRSALADTKGKMVLTASEQAALGAYCVDDTNDTYGIFWKLYDVIPDEELQLIDLTLRMFCDPVLTIDLPRVQSELEKEVGGKVAALLKSGTNAEDLLSNNKFAALLNAAGCPAPMKISPATGKPAYAFAKSDEAFQYLLTHKNEKVRALAEARLKIKSTIGETRAVRFLEAGKGGNKLPILLHYSGAHTHRWSGGNKMNLQNLVRGGELRKSIMAPKGHVVVVADSAQIEARVLAWVAGQMDLVNAFATKQDVYKLMASAIFNKPVDQITKDERFIGKVCIAEGSLVLTDKGLVPIEKVTLDHKVWDGVRWVDHDGVVYQGYKEVITYDGLTATPDHKVYAQGHSLPIQIRDAASSMDRLVRSEAGGQAVRVSEGYLPAYTSQGRLQDGEVPMHSMPDSQTDQSGQPHERQEQWVPKLLSETVELVVRAWETIRCLEISMHFAERSALRTLRGTRNHMQLCLQSGVHTLRRTALAPPGLQGRGDRPDRQQWSLRAGQSTPCHPNREQPQPAGQHHNPMARQNNTVGGVPQPLCVHADTSVRRAGDDRGADHQSGLAVRSGEAQGLEANTSKAHVYDILNAGPNRRFTVSGVLVANCVLGLGYGMGPVKLMAYLAQSGIRVERSEAQRMVKIYRDKNSKIQQFWKKMDQVILAMATGATGTLGPITYGKNYICLPNGMFLQYYGMHGEMEVRYDNLVMTEATYLTRYGRTKIYGGLLTENLVQALARVIVADQMLEISKKYRVVTMSHDEVVAVCPKAQGKQCLADMLRIMSTPPSWAPDLPLAAEGGMDVNYSK